MIFFNHTLIIYLELRYLYHRYYFYVKLIP